MKKLVDLCIFPESTCKEILVVLNDVGSRILLVVSEDDSLLGTLTDGDIRRGLLKGLSLDDEISEFMNSSPVFQKEGGSREDRVSIMKLHDLIAIPIVSQDGKVVDLEFLNK